MESVGWERMSREGGSLASSGGLGAFYCFLLFCYVTSSFSRLAVSLLLLYH
jgi:hypothetical protein